LFESSANKYRKIIKKPSIKFKYVGQSQLMTVSFKFPL